jgi:hypothetical protein
VLAVVGGAEKLHPEVDRVDKLPVVHGLDGILLLQGDGVAQTDAQLPEME